MNSILERKFDLSNRYELSDYKKGEMFPAVSDTMFSTMFNNSSKKKYVSYLLSLVLNKDYDEIYNSIEFSKDKLDNDNYYDSKRSVDLVCKIEGEYYNIEMNNNNKRSMLERNIEYVSKLYSDSNKTGNDYIYNKVVQININNFSFDGYDKVFDTFNIQNSDGEILTNKIIIIYISLPNIRKKLYNKLELNELEKLLLVINEKDSDELSKLIGGNRIMKDYREDAYNSSQDEHIVGLYDREAMLERLKKIDLLEEHEEGYEEGIEEGIAQGFEQGIKRGIEQGIEQGKKETMSSLIKSMYQKNISIEMISEITNTDIKKIKRIINE